MSNWADDPKVIENVAAKLLAHMQSQGYPDADTTRAAIARHIRQNPQEWNKPDVVEGGVTDLAAKAVKRYAKRGVKPNTSPPSPDVISSQTALTWLTTDAKERPDVAGAVAAMRRQFWRIEQPPFPFLELGRPEALDRSRDWLRSQREVDQAQFDAAPFQRWQLELDIRIDGKPDDVNAFFEVNQILENMRKGTGEAASPLRLGEFMQREKISMPGWRRASAPRKEILIVRADGYERRCAVYEGGQLEIFWEHTKDIAAISGWWNQQGAILYVLTGIPPAPEHRTTFSPHNETPILEFKFVGPVRKDEVLQLYDKVVRAHEARAPRISPTQAALLQLRAQTPLLTWQERLSTWIQWREERYPELRDFAKTRCPDKEMRKEWERGRQAMRWQFPWSKSKKRTWGSTPPPSDIPFDADLII